MKVILKDRFNNGYELELKIWKEKGKQALLITPKGYGDKCSVAGKGAPIMIELYSGELSLVVWDDINKEERSHRISLEGAKESNRKELTLSYIFRDLNNNVKIKEKYETK